MSLLFPKKTKFKKYQKLKRRFKGVSSNYFYPKFGFFALKTLSCNRITAKHIETVRQFVQKKLKKKIKHKIKICIFPDLPVTKKSSGIRMGKGKGAIDYWCYIANPGRILFELNFNALRKNAYHILNLAGKKLPLKTKIIFQKKIY